MSERKQSARDQGRAANNAVTLEQLRSVGSESAISFSDTRRTIGEVLDGLVTDDMVSGAITSRSGFMRTYHDPVSNRSFQFSSDQERSSTVHEFLAREMARKLFTTGLSVAQTQEDVDIWHSLVQDDQSLALGKTPIRGEKVPRLTLPEASQVMESVTIGRRDRSSLASLAMKWWRIHELGDKSEIPPELQNLAIQIIQGATNRLGGTASDFKLRLIGGEFTLNRRKELFLAYLRDKSEAHKLPEDEVTMLKEARASRADSPWYFEGLTKYAKQMQGGHFNNNDELARALDIQRTGYVLLGKALGMARDLLPGTHEALESVRTEQVYLPERVVANWHEKALAVAKTPSVVKRVERTPQNDVRRRGVLSSEEAVSRILSAIADAASSGRIDPLRKRTILSAVKCTGTMMNFAAQRKDEEAQRMV